MACLSVRFAVARQPVVDATRSLPLLKAGATFQAVDTLPASACGLV